MRIYLSDNHHYPARLGGLGSRRVSDLLAKGLAELGHAVDYHLKGEVRARLPAGVRRVFERGQGYHILHLQDAALDGARDTGSLPWVRTLHAEHGLHAIASDLKPHLIYVSRAHARRVGSQRYVHNGIDPSEYFYQESKDDYFLFLVSGLERAHIKGIEVAFALVCELGIELVVAGSSSDAGCQRAFAKDCAKRGIRFVGEVHGQRKAELLASAKALLFPTLMDEPFGLVAVEALVSGTPVICSERGACPELVNDEVGIRCHDLPDYRAAIERIGAIAPRACRRHALKAFHYHAMARNYLIEYERQIAATG